MRFVTALVTGALFALGLIVSDMVNPARVLGFLDLAAIPTGGWDPTLGFVMAGALVPMALAWRFAAARRAPVFGGSFPGRPAGGIDGRLLGGAALFGAGWGLVGFCPGPALTALATGNIEALIFCAAMAVGMYMHRLATTSPHAV